jgi:hypothetical protein
MNSFDAIESGSKMNTANVGTDFKQTEGPGVALVQYLIYDMLDQSNSSNSELQRLFERTVKEWFKESHTVSSIYWHYGMYCVLISMHIGVLYYMMVKAASRGYDWQVSFFQGSLWELMLDTCLTIPIELFILDYWIPAILLSPSVAGMIEQMNMPNDSAIVAREHGFKQYIAPSGLLPRELDRFLKRHPRLSEQRLVFHAYKQNTLHAALLLWKRGLLQCVSVMPEYVLHAIVQLIATASATLIVFLKIFVFHPLLVSYIQSYYLLTCMAWLLAFFPAVAAIGYVMYDAVYHDRDMNRICHETDIIPEEPRVDNLEDSNKCAEVSLSFIINPSVSSEASVSFIISPSASSEASPSFCFTSSVSSLSGRLSLSSHVSGGEQREDQLDNRNSSDSDSMSS